MNRLGSPKELAKSYLTDLLTKEKNFRIRHILAVCAFYSITGFSGLFVIPVLGIIAPSFLLFGLLSPLAGAGRPEAQKESWTYRETLAKALP